MNDLQNNLIIVSKKADSSIDSISKAIEKAKLIRSKDSKSGIKIYIEEGIYSESVYIDINNIILEGKKESDVIITNNLSAFDILPDGSKRGTFRTATLHLASSNIKLKNLTIENSSGNGKEYGQCVALYCDGDKINVENCILKGNQDTLFTAPLPQSDKYGSNVGLGPRAAYERKHCRQIFYNCTIFGNIDFIFGGATALFYLCNIFVLDDLQDRDTKAYIAAPCTVVDLEYGFLFYKCKIDGNVENKSIYLARPWRLGAKSVFFDCDINANLVKNGSFHDWNKPIAQIKSFFALDNISSTDLELVEWAKKLNDKQKKEYLIGYYKYLFSDNPKKWIADKENI
ncbi:MAG: pectinesterase family protein [Pleomorphochaeta sp.]